ncbi:MAG: hypothetical protein IPJ49_10705 [Candidatus Obscuribacter sp.]|nr:hypothetical protein [Candidatus Obscuribacter sp.]
MPASNATEDIIGGTYRVISLIGEGGMGTVFAVEHIILQKQFALKMLSKGNFTPPTGNASKTKHSLWRTSNTTILFR